MNAIVQFQAPRLPYHPVVEERFGIDKGGWKVLCEAVFPAAESPDSIVMALAYCRARNLDIFKKPVQIVPIYDRKRGGMVDTVWPGIAELRTTAMRTGSFAGFDETTFGPDVNATLGGAEMVYPEWAQCTVYRLIAGQRVPFIGPKVYWLETYATAKRDTAAPNAMWRKRPRGQLEKCAEAAALRRAFPEELGNEYAAEEVHGRALGVDGAPAMTTIEPAKALKLHSDFDEPQPAHDAETGEVIEAEVEAVEAAEEPAVGQDVAEETPANPEPGLPGLKSGADLAAEQEATKPPLAQRIAGWKANCERATSTVKLADLWARSSELRNDIDAADPDEHGTVEQLQHWWQAIYDAAEAKEREAQS